MDPRCQDPSYKDPNVREAKHGVKHLPNIQRSILHGSADQQPIPEGMDHAGRDGIGKAALFGLTLICVRVVTATFVGPSVFLRLRSPHFFS